MREIYENIIEPRLISELKVDEIANLVNTQVQPINYLLPPKTQELRPLPDKTYTNNKRLWREVLDEQLRANITITLKDFLLFEWFPRSPGLFHTRAAESARNNAMQFLINRPQTFNLRRRNERSRAQEEAEKAYKKYDSSFDHMYIFNPHGKISMLKGGIGSIRLKPKSIESEKVWFMSASSTPVAHEGFPVVIPETLLPERDIDRIAKDGGLPCTLIGKLKFLPDHEPLVSLYGDYNNVPQLYLFVEEIRPGDLPKESQGKSLMVSAAVSFLSSFEGHEQMYASYVTFYPDVKGSLKSRVDWLENVYVKGMYQGRIVTNFDEHMKRFEDAVFSLEKVMNKKLSENEVMAFNNARGIRTNITVLGGLVHHHDERDG